MIPRGIPRGIPGIPGGLPGDPPGIPRDPRGSPGDPGGTPRGRGAAGCLFQKLPAVSESAPELPHWIWVKKVGARFDKMSFMVYTIFLGRSKINSFKFRCRSVLTGSPFLTFWNSNDFRWFQLWPEIVEGINKMAISEFIPPNPRQSPAVPGNPPIRCHWQRYGTYLLHAPGARRT